MSFDSSMPAMRTPSTTPVPASTRRPISAPMAVRHYPTDWLSETLLNALSIKDGFISPPEKR
jgi:hypothetical protein